MPIKNLFPSPAISVKGMKNKAETNQKRATIQTEIRRSFMLKY